MKTRLFLIAIFWYFLSFPTFGSCVIEPWSLEKRIQLSDLVVEGTITDQYSTWDKNQHLIYTINTIKVSRVFKGEIQNSSVLFITEGGIVGTDFLDVNPALKAQKGEQGVFLLKTDAHKTINGVDYQPTANIQSFIKYDLKKFSAFDYLTEYELITNDLYPELRAYCKRTETTINPFTTNPDKNKPSPLANPTINSINKDTATAGTRDFIIIVGSNFGTTIGKVGFKDADFGDNRYYYSPTLKDIKSWTNNRIEVYVPSKAGTGKVQVVDNQGNSGESAKELVIKWAHINILYPVGTDTSFHQIDLIDDNNLGGFTWQYATNFTRNIPAQNAFIRSLEEWRCETGMNWIVGNTTNEDSVKRDNINIVRFTKFTDSKLGVCYSYYNGCFSNATTIHWFINEMDIQFDSTRKWHYETTQTPTTFIDFQTVTTHELGHGHQLGHVRDVNKVMHYSLGAGTKKSDLVADDIEAGAYIIAKSIVTNVCGPQAHKKVAINECNITKPKAAFSISKAPYCVNQNIVITENSEGKINTYQWTLGDDATPNNSTDKDPGTIVYSAPGIKTIQLITTNDFGADTINKEILVHIDTISTPNWAFDKNFGCIGKDTFKIDSIANAIGYTWKLIGNGRLLSDSTNLSVAVEWLNSGLSSLSVKALGVCSLSDYAIDTLQILPNPKAQFSIQKVRNSEVTFLNQSLNADTYLWNMGDGSTYTETNPIHQFLEKKEFTVNLSAINTCASSDSSFLLDLRQYANVNKLQLKSGAFFPNPVLAGDILSFSLDMPISSIILHSSLGLKVALSETHIGQYSVPKNITSGIYTLTYMVDNQLFYSKLTVISK